MLLAALTAAAIIVGLVWIGIAAFRAGPIIGVFFTLFVLGCIGAIVGIWLEERD